MQQHRFLRALACENDEGPPIWVMRQAGRYLPEYRALRQKYSFFEMSHIPELIAAITLMPTLRFDLDAAIIFSDILMIPEAMGLPFEFLEGRGPVLDRPLRSFQDLMDLQLPNLATLSFVSEGIKMTKPELKVPLIGFCGGPFTVASYLIEGESSRDFKKTKQWMYNDPEGFHKLLALVTDLSINYLKNQVAAGVDVVQIFDSWANVLAERQFEEFSLSYMRAIVKEMTVPTIIFCRGSCQWADKLAASGTAAVGLDWSRDMAQIRKEIGPKVALQGNLDPDLLYAPKNVIQRETNRLLDSMEGDRGFIVNLGHGISPDVPVSAMQTLIDCVQQRKGATVP